jgi:hypothetical protein
MKTEEINQLFTRFEEAASELEGVECWSARELQILLGYSKWENFEKVIQKGDFSKKCVNFFSLFFAAHCLKTVGRRAMCCKATKL